MLDEILNRHIAAVQRIPAAEQQILEAVDLLSSTFRTGGKVLLCGNGGSAADCQHIAAELVGRFVRERPGYPAVALTTDTSILTAVGNDYQFDQIFARQVQALMQPIDVLWCISTSGHSPNVLEAARYARERIGARVIAFTGSRRSPLAEYADVAVAVGGTETARVQECHLLIAHAICELLEAQP